MPQLLFHTRCTYTHTLAYFRLSLSFECATLSFRCAIYIRSRFNVCELISCSFFFIHSMVCLLLGFLLLFLLRFSVLFDSSSFLFASHRFIHRLNRHKVSLERFVASKLNNFAVFFFSWQFHLFHFLSPHLYFLFIVFIDTFSRGRC